MRKGSVLTAATTAQLVLSLETTAVATSSEVPNPNSGTAQSSWRKCWGGETQFGRVLADRRSVVEDVATRVPKRRRPPRVGLEMTRRASVPSGAYRGRRFAACFFSGNIQAVRVLTAQTALFSHS